MQQSAPAETLSTKPHRILCLQHSSLFEQYGGVEYYLDDTLTLASSIYGANAVHTLVPDRTGTMQLRPRTYSVETVAHTKNPLMKKVENRLSPRLVKQAILAIQRHKPTLILNAHVSLGPVAMAIARTSGIPVVTIAYGIECWGGLWPQDEWALKSVNGILSISHWTKKVLVDRGFAADKIEILHPGMVGDFPPEPTKPLGAESKFTLLSISRLDATEQYKGQDHVLSALSRLKGKQTDVQFRYIIQGQGTDLPRLKELTKTLDLESMVEFRPPTHDRESLQAIYREADVFIMPSRYGYWDKKWRGEGFGIVYVEAAAHGVPSIAYKCGGAMDIIVPDETGLLVQPENIDELARAINTLARDKEKLHRLAKNAYHHVKANFTRAPLRQELITALNKF